MPRGQQEGDLNARRVEVDPRGPGSGERAHDDGMIRAGMLSESCPTTAVWRAGRWGEASVVTELPGT